MPPRVSENPEVQSQYLTQLALTSALFATLRKLWPTIEPSDIPGSFPLYRRGVAAVVAQFSEASISLSGDYYEAMREQAGITTPFRLPTVDPLTDAQIQAYLDTVVGDLEADVAAIQQKVDAASQGLVANAGRDQVTAALAGDEKATGFARVARPDACAFCLTLAMRGAVYKSRSTAGQVLSPNTLGQVNRYHDNCNCGVQPVFTPRGEYEFPAHITTADETYTDAVVAAIKAGTNSGANWRINAFRRALAAQRK